MTVPVSLVLGHRYHTWRRGIGNFALLATRHCQGQLVSMHQSGTHWLKYMLANALSYQHGTPPPAYNHANDIIGGPRDPVIYPELPRLVASHSMPHPLLRCARTHAALDLPRYVMLVRDIRATLVSNYVKWRARYGVDFPVYLRGDVSGRRYNSDIWWALRFLDGWGAVRARAPDRVLLVRYEELQRHTAAELARVAAHFRLDLSPAALAHGITVSDKASMQARDDPRRPPGAVRVDDADDPTFSADDRAFVTAVCTQCLRYPAGYDYTRW